MFLPLLNALVREAEEVGYDSSQAGAAMSLDEEDVSASKKAKPVRHYRYGVKLEDTKFPTEKDFVDELPRTDLNSNDDEVSMLYRSTHLAAKHEARSLIRSHLFCSLPSISQSCQTFYTRIPLPLTRPNTTRS